MATVQAIPQHLYCACRAHRRSANELKYEPELTRFGSRSWSEGGWLATGSFHLLPSPSPLWNLFLHSHRHYCHPPCSMTQFIFKNSLTETSEIYWNFQKDFSKHSRRTKKKHRLKRHKSQGPNFSCSGFCPVCPFSPPPGDNCIPAHYTGLLAVSLAAKTRSQVPVGHPARDPVCVLRLSWLFSK